MENSEKIVVSIIILSWNTKELLRKCLQSVFNSQVSPFGLEVIVVDNGSTDGSPKMVKKFFPKIKFLGNNKNLGFAKGNNLGLKIATGKLIMLLNSDTIVQPDAIKKIADFLMSSGPSTGGASPLLMNTDGTLQRQYYMKFPNLWQIFLYHHPVFRPLTMRLFSYLIVSVFRGSQPQEVDQLPGAALMAKKETWEKVGLLDEDYQFLYEDVDWCYRARRSGYKLFVVPQSSITHLGGGSWKQKIKTADENFYRQFFSSLLLFVKKNYGDVKMQIFRLAVIKNFMLQLKFSLAKEFLFSHDPSSQKKLWS